MENAKALADVGFGFHPDFAMHHFDELAADAQAEAGPAVAARGGGVNLPERLEELAEELGRDPDARVAHEADDLHAPLFRAGVGRQRFGMALLERHADLPAGAGEFHRIGHEVHDDLLEAPGIADQRDLHVRVHVYDEGSMPPAWALCRATVQTWCTTSSSMNGACSSSRCPASIFDTSSRSLMISRSAREDWRMARR